MGLASSAGAFPLAVIDDSVRCADTGVSVTPIILPSSNGSDSGVSLPARPQLCPATSQPAFRFELSKCHVTMTSHRNAFALANPSPKRGANIPRLKSSSRETFRQPFPAHSHAISWKTLLRLLAAVRNMAPDRTVVLRRMTNSVPNASPAPSRRSVASGVPRSGRRANPESGFPEVLLAGLGIGHEREWQREQRAHRQTEHHAG